MWAPIVLGIIVLFFIGVGFVLAGFNSFSEAKNWLDKLCTIPLIAFGGMVLWLDGAIVGQIIEHLK